MNPEGIFKRFLITFQMQILDLKHKASNDLWKEEDP